MDLRPAGDRAILVDLPDLETVHGLTAAARQALEDGDLPPGIDIVPGYRTLLLSGAPAGDLAAAVHGLDPRSPDALTAEPVEIPVVYDGEDLDEVAERTGLTVQEVIERHTTPDYTVAFLGFTPGFPYLLGLDEKLHVPRRSTPRTTVPAGAVGLAGSQTGVYPRPSPGGWQLLGHTDAVLFDPDREPPALLAPGGRLRFAAVESASAAEVPERPPLREGSLLVRQAGPQTTVQDLGRTGFAHLGVPQAGAVDVRSARLANRLVGNAESAALLEVTLGGIEMVFEDGGFVAVSGAPAPLAVNGRPIGEDSGFGIPAGGVLTVGTVSAGLRCYIAIRGGLDVRPVLGSRSTDTLAGLGPEPLRDGDRLPVGHRECEQVYHEVAPTAPPPEQVELRLMPGPRDDWLTTEARQRLLGTAWSVSATSDRTGLRLEGPALERASTGELLSEGMVAGAVQVPPDGQPILFLANHPTTGGYPVAGVVLTDDLPLAGQARPGTILRFRAVPAPRL